MKKLDKLTINPNNKRYYSDEYIKGWEDGVKAQYEATIDAVELIHCEECRHRNTWDNGRLVPQYYRCGKGVKFRDYGYVREDDYCPLGERRKP